MNTIRRSLMNSKSEKEGLYAVTKKNNAPVMAICYAQGWAANENYMTFEEAEAVTDIGTVFQNNQNVITFDELQYFTNIPNIPENAFSNCANITSITLPQQVTSIGNRAFYKDNKIKHFIVPDNVTSIAFYTFHTTAFDSFTIGAGISSITDNGGNFYSVLGTKAYKLSLAITNYKEEDGVIYSNDKTQLRLFPSLKTGTFTIPSFVTSISNYAFNNSRLSHINLPSNLTQSAYGDRCFLSAKFISVEIPNSWISLKRVFNTCSNLVTFDIPSTVTSFDAYALYINTIKNLIVRNTIPPSTQNSSFERLTITNIYVPDASVNTYKTTGKWADFASYIHPLSEYVPS